MYITEHWQDYQTAIRAASRPYDTVYGTITFTDSTTMTVDGSVLPTNAITISKQCIEGGELMFGGVFLSTLELSVITNKDRYAFFGAVVELYYKIKIGEEEVGGVTTDIYETVPLGIYTVADAERPSSKEVKMTAYDSMTLLDKEIGDEYITGTPWEVLSLVSTMTGYPLAFIETDLANFTNYTYTLSASADRGLKTYRDVVKEVCQQLGCFALDDRTGNLALKKFSSATDLSLTTSDWYSIVPADYKSTYKAISITGLMGTYVKVSDNPLETGNVMTIEDAPAWDLGTDETLQFKTDNLFSVLMQIDEYTPCEIDMPSDPTFDCGDRLRLVTRDSGEIFTLITSYEWKFHAGMSITSEGKNPYLETTNVLSADSARILQQAVEKSKLQFVSFTNSAKKVIGNNDTAMIGRAVFTPTTDTSALFVATILVDVDVADTSTTTTEEVNVPVTAYDAEMQPTVITDINGNPVSLTGTATNTYTYLRDGKCELDIYYTLNDVKVPNDENPYIAIEQIEKGRHIITVAYPISGLLAYERADWAVWITSKGGTVTVPVHTLEATIIGQEITSIERFNGELKVSENIATIALNKLGELKYKDSADIAFIEVQSYNVSEDIGRVNNAYLNAFDANENASIVFIHEFSFCAENGNRIITENDDRIFTE
jgi:hypothetical protein